MSRILSEFADNWRQFLLIHVVVHALIIVLLVPAATLLLQFSVWFSGNVVISDEDILRYIFSPSGSVLAMILLALFSIIVFLEYAALLPTRWGTMWSSISGMNFPAASAAVAIAG